MATEANKKTTSNNNNGVKKDAVLEPSLSSDKRAPPEGHTKKKPSRFDQVTRNEAEAETAFLAALDNPSSKRGSRVEKPSKDEGDDDYDDHIVPMEPLASVPKHAPLPEEDNGKPSSKKPKPTPRPTRRETYAQTGRTRGGGGGGKGMGITTRYIMALHEADEHGTGSTTEQFFQDENSDDEESLAHISAAGRVAWTAAVFQQAANKEKSKNQKEPSQARRRRTDHPEEASGGGGGNVSTYFQDHHSQSLLDPQTVGGDQSNGNVDVEAAEIPRRRKFVAYMEAVPAAMGQGLQDTMSAAVQEIHSLHDFFKPKRQNVREEAFVILLWLILPCSFVASMLFYIGENPPTGRCEGGVVKDPYEPTSNDTEVTEYCGYRYDYSNMQYYPVASASWWVLFLGVRWIVVWLLARVTDVLVIDWLVLQHPKMVRFLGARIALIVVQSKGWPSVMFWWAIWNACLLYGNTKFNKHWLYYQDVIGLFNNENPPGDVTTAVWFRDMIICAFVFAGAVSLKRYFMGLYLGGRIYTRFNTRIHEILTKIMLVSELALWTRNKRDSGSMFAEWIEHHHRRYDDGFTDSTPAEAEEAEQQDSPTKSEQEASTGSQDATKKLAKVKERRTVAGYEKEMDAWTEPAKKGAKRVTGNQIIELRRAFTVMTKPYFFSSAFGPVDTREQCIISSDYLFFQLLFLMGEKTGYESSLELEGDSDDEWEPSISVRDLTFWMNHGCHSATQKERALQMVDLLSPDHEGRITALGFVKAIDVVYKEIRLLENAVNNASDIDKSYERLMNFFFYLILGAIALVILGLDVMALVYSLSSLIISFSFMIGPASATYFEGILLVLGRQAYDIGDKIAIALIEDEPNPDGSTHWLVESVDLVSTTARLMATNELTSFSNGSLARARLMNMNRSPDPFVCVPVRFATDTPYSTILVFRAAVEKFVEERPQEWAKFSGFRTNRVEPQLNFVEYSIVLMHKLTWQSLIPIKESKAAVSSFCVELQKKLGCYYSAPSMPVELTVAGNDNKTAQEGSVVDPENKDASVNELMKMADMFGATKKDQ